MDFDAWKQEVSDRLRRFAGQARSEIKAAGPHLLYGSLAGMALWPVAQAVKGGDLAALGALFSVGAGVGANLIANQVQSWKDEADAAQKLAGAAEGDPEVRAALDAILDRLEALPVLESALPDADRVWFSELLQSELRRVGSRLMVSATDGSAAAANRGIAQVGSGNWAFSGDIQGGVTILQEGAKGPDPVALRQAYLCRLVAQTRGLPLTGVDRKAASDAECADLELAAVYTALLTQQMAAGREGALRPDPEGRDRRLSAVEVLNGEPRLALLGDPGSGKSTFVDFVALCLAGEALGEDALGEGWPGAGQANLALLTAPLPDDRPSWERREEEPWPQPWDHGALLPVRVVLRDLAARGLPPPGRRAGGDDLWRFIVAELGQNLAGYAPHLQRELREKGGLVLLDGLDEVPEAGKRREQVKQVVTGFAADFPRCRFLVTSRTYAYQQQAWKLPGFAEAVLAPFGPGQIERFVDRWYAHMALLRNLHTEDARGRATLLKAAIQRSERLAELAARPLLLTLMASLHAWRGGSLPEKREELYADVVDLLLDQWESPKVVRDEAGQPVLQQRSLAEWLKVDRQVVRSLLNQLAFEGHRDQPQLLGTADLSQSRLVDGLMQATRNPEVNPAQIVVYVRDRAGLLAARGEGVYTFPHRTFQEYLAACHLTDHAFPEELALLLSADPERWREVTLLAAAKASRGTPFAVWSLVEALCYEEPPEGQPGEAGGWGALLAAQALVETEQLAVVSPRNQAKVERLRRWLRRLVEVGQLPPVDRALAADTLSHLGDPRPGVGLGPGGAPDMVWCEVPAGPFAMGTKKTDLSALQQRYGGSQGWYQEETPQVDIQTPAFYVARYPVTVAQFAAFAGDGGYTTRRFWTRAGWEWLESEKVSGPPQVGDPFDLPNHPAVGVSWYESMALCRWLTEKAQEEGWQLEVWREGQIETIHLLGEHGLQIRLPTEAEWEKAARGDDGRQFPWGEGFDRNRCNTGEDDIRSTSAAGLYPCGASPYGALDMAGNVWEWCHSLYKPYPYQVDDGREDAEAEGSRVLRGGSWYLDQIYARCACRDYNHPDSRDFNLGFRVVVAPSLPS